MEKNKWKRCRNPAHWRLPLQWWFIHCLPFCFSTAYHPVARRSLRFVKIFSFLGFFFWTEFFFNLLLDTNKKKDSATYFQASFPLLLPLVLTFYQKSAKKSTVQEKKKKTLLRSRHNKVEWRRPKTSPVCLFLNACSISSRFQPALVSCTAVRSTNSFPKRCWTPSLTGRCAMRATKAETSA